MQCLMAPCTTCGTVFPAPADRLCPTCGAPAEPLGQVDAAPAVEAQPLPRFRYPITIVLASVLTLAAVGYSFLRAPTLVQADRDLRTANTAIAHHDYVTAAAVLSDAHSAVPTSRKITIELAEADFGADKGSSAMRLLSGVRLSPSEWHTLLQTMPAQYQKYFVRASS